jgi:hypothetical protein
MLSHRLENRKKASFRRDRRIKIEEIVSVIKENWHKKTGLKTGLV